MMKLKAFFLLTFFVASNDIFAQRRSDLICASDTGRIKIEPGLYILLPLTTKINGLNVRSDDKYYCIEKENKLPLDNIDSINISFDKYSQKFGLNFHFNKLGTEQLASFSKSQLGKEVGFFIDNELLSAGKLFGILARGNMTLEGNFSEVELLILKEKIKKAVHK